jgi:hypothetical protein
MPRGGRRRYCARCGGRTHYTDDCGAFARETGNSGKFCQWCSNLSWRRPYNGCPGCREPFRAESIERVSVSQRSSAGLLLEE